MTRWALPAGSLQGMWWTRLRAALRDWDGQLCHSSRRPLEPKTRHASWRRDSTARAQAKKNRPVPVGLSAPIFPLLLEYVAHGVGCFTHLRLDLPRDSFGGAFSLRCLVAGDLADRFLDGAGHLPGRTFNPILIHDVVPLES